MSGVNEGSGGAGNGSNLAVPPGIPVDTVTSQVPSCPCRDDRNRQRQIEAEIENESSDWTDISSQSEASSNATPSSLSPSTQFTPTTSGESEVSFEGSLSSCSSSPSYEARGYKVVQQCNQCECHQYCSKHAKTSCLHQDYPCHRERRRVERMRCGTCAFCAHHRCPCGAKGTCGCFGSVCYYCGLTCTAFTVPN